MCRISLLLLQLLLSLQADGHVSGCFEGLRTVELSKSDIVRTWQPDGDCQWWPNGRSETNRFPAAVRSGPRWLVMQLRQPLVLDRVSLRGWDGQLQTAGAVGSPVSAVGAASLPVKLQLEDPCRASWEAFGSSDHWRHLGEARSGDLGGAAASFVLLNSSRRLQWMSINVTGRAAALQFVSPSFIVKFCGDLNSMESRDSGDRICFSVLSCHPRPQQSNVSCGIRGPSGSLSIEIQTNSAKRGLHEEYLFEFELSRQLHGSVLSCSRGPLQADRVERVIFMRISAKNSSISTPTAVWLSGRPGFVSFVTVESYPEPRHQCCVGDRDLTSCDSPASIRLNATSSHLSIVDSHNGPLFTMWTNFSILVSMEMSRKTIRCEESSTVSSTKKHLEIPSVSEPCETNIDLGSARYWLETDGFKTVQVKSSKCSHWNVTHSCRLINLTTNISEMLNKTQQGSFSSEHRLPLSRWIRKQNWRVRCSVTQSGLEYPDVESNSRLQPQVFYKASLKATYKIVENFRISIVINCSDANPLVSELKCNATWEPHQLQVELPSIPKLVAPSAFELEIGSFKSTPATLVCIAWQQYDGEQIFNIHQSFDLPKSILSKLRLESQFQTTPCEAPVSSVLMASAALFTGAVVFFVVAVILTAYSSHRIARRLLPRRGPIPLRLYTRPKSTLAVVSPSSEDSPYEEPGSVLITTTADAIVKPTAATSPCEGRALFHVPEALVPEDFTYDEADEPLNTQCRYANVPLVQTNNDTEPPMASEGQMYINSTPTWSNSTK